MTRHREFTRQELYDLVWSTPLTKLSKDFGLSDVGLRKVCIKHEIPTPPLGYWAKLNFGKTVQQTPLHEPGEGVSNRVLVSVFATTELPEEVAQAEIQARERLTEPVIVPLEMPDRIHPLAQALKRALRSAKATREGFLHTKGSGIVTTTIGQPSTVRAVLLIDTLFKTLERMNHQIKSSDEGVDIVIKGERMRLEIGETKNKRAHEPTKSELKAKADWDESRSKYPSLYSSDRRHWSTWDHFPSGRLSLTLSDPLRSSWQSSHLLGRWHDRRTTSLESYTNAILIAMLTGTAIVRHNRIAAEAEARRQQEAHKAWLLERERLRKLEELDRFIEEMADGYARLRKLMDFRDYLAKFGSDGSGHEHHQTYVAAVDLIDRLEQSLAIAELDRAVTNLDS
ncbi:MAG: hypothetical protein J0G36_00045 [Afipia sp.]|nr:hypothetical protein [Afipia sp.]